jgi:hypothetical protein
VGPALVVALLLAADGDVTAPPPRQAPTRESAGRVAAIGILTSAITLGLTMAIPAFYDPKNPGSGLPLVLGSAAFVGVAVVRPIVFFGAAPPQTTASRALRIIGTLTAFTGLAAFISGFVMRATSPGESAWGMFAAAGLETMSSFSFSLDALMAAD